MSPGLYKTSRVQAREEDLPSLVRSGGLATFQVQRIQQREHHSFGVLQTKLVTSLLVLDRQLTAR